MTRIANIDGRPHLLDPDGAVLVPPASAATPPTFTALYAEWDVSLASLAAAGGEPHRMPLERFGAPSPEPRQVFGIGLNYRSHALESGLPLPTTPLVFTKFPSCVGGPTSEIPVVSEQVDWEVEIAVVIGEGGRAIAASDAWDHVAGVCIAQDVSARDLQMQPPATPQFSLGKSAANFLPMGPVLVTPDELPDRDDVPLVCEVNGTVMQDGATSDLVFDIPFLVAHLSSVVRLLPGDVILTGTPSGVGLGQSPPRYLAPGDVVVSRSLAGLGVMRNVCVAP